MNHPTDLGAIDVAHSSKRSGKKGIVIFIIAIFLGAAGVYLSNQFIQSKVEYFKDKYESQKEQTRSVVVVVRSMKKGEIVTQNDLGLRDVPVAFAHKSAITEENYNLAIGQKLTFDIQQGMALLWPHLEGGEAPTFSGKIDGGKRAITIPVDEVSSISGFLEPTDNIDLYLTQTIGDEKSIFPLIQNLHVMATGVKTTVDKSSSAMTTYRTITVSVTPEDAKKIFLAQNIGGITATLRHPDDEEDIKTDPLTESDLLGKKKKIIKKKKATKPGIEFIIGGV
jgi:pilus assembly protein CpaB